MAFGAYVRQQREAKGIAMNELARRIGISPAYWSRIERSMEKPPKDELIQKAAEILGLDSDEAFIKANRFPPDMHTTLIPTTLLLHALPLKLLLSMLLFLNN